MIRKLLIVLVMMLGLAGCGGRQSLSGIYVEKDQQGAALLQLTENQGQQLMGSLTIVALKADGSIGRIDVSITGGTTDGTSLTLSMKPNEIFGQTQNISGEVSNGGIDLTMGTSTLHFSPSTPQDFESVAQSLAVEGQRHQKLIAQARALANDAKVVVQLTADLNAYSARIESSTGSPKQVQEQEQKILIAAGNDLRLMRQLEARNQEYPAGQVRFRIGQFAFQMGQIEFQIDQVVNLGHDHLQGFDQRLAVNPCSTARRLNGCDGLTSAQQRYGSIRTRVLNNLVQLTSDLQHSQTEMARINKEAGN